jgi:methionine-rich copper-binding protein CopC
MSAIPARAAAGCALGVLVALLGQPPAGAHSDLVSSYPAAGERVGSLPEQVVLEFDEPMSVGTDGLVIRAPGGDSYPADVLGSAAGDVYVAILEPVVRPGTWTVDYEAVSRDGHRAVGTVSFWVGASGGPPPLTDPTSLSRTLAMLLVLLAGGFSVLLRALGVSESTT